MYVHSAIWPVSDFLWSTRKLPSNFWCKKGEALLHRRKARPSFWCPRNFVSQDISMTEVRSFLGF